MHTSTFELHNSLFAGEPQPLSTPIVPVAPSQQTPSITSDPPSSSYSSTLPSVVFDTPTSPEQYQEQDYVPQAPQPVTQSKYIKNPNSKRPSRSKRKEKEKSATTSGSSWYYIIGAGAVLLLAVTACSGSGSFEGFSKSGVTARRPPGHVIHCKM